MHLLQNRSFSEINILMLSVFTFYRRQLLFDPLLSRSLPRHKYWRATQGLPGQS